MKIIAALILTFFIGKGCHQEYQQDMESTIIEYTANSRGNFYRITVQNQMVSVSRDRKKIEPPVTTKLTDADWKEIVNDFRNNDQLRVNNRIVIDVPAFLFPDKTFSDSIDHCK